MSAKLSQRVYDHICRQLLTGGMRGGDRLSELKLVAETGASRSPVREALVRLRAEGVLDHVPKLGSSVRTPSREDLEQLYAAREWLEAGAAVELARQGAAANVTLLQKLNDEILSIARSVFQLGSLTIDEARCARLSAIDTEFHLALMKATHNPFGVRMLAHTHMLIQVGGYRLSRYSAEHVTRLYSDHDLIIRAIRRGDEQGAWVVTKDHLRWNLDSVRAQFKPPEQAEGATDTVRPVGDWPEPMRVLLEQLSARTSA